LLENAQIAPKTRERYVVLLKRINAAIGGIKLHNIQAHHLGTFYKNLAEAGIKEKGRFAVVFELSTLMKDRKMTQVKLSKLADVAPATVGAARIGKKVSIENAEKIANAIGVYVK
jgi:hypothetical protein